MPHLIIDYSANLEDAIDMAGLCERLRVVATGLEAFPAAGVRVRAHAARHYAIADGNSAHGFIDVSVRLRAGRDPEVKKAATQALFDAAEAFIAPVMATRPIALSFEMRDIDPALSPKTGTIRDHLEG
ncbi:5-carboxymethyl-2-hydroxymuconate isomerase [Sulfitobacter alexandrii]|uniref:5-carboxymethyl-2-hydroxymuconate isomerase n=1 Tax=Sulfitobacter alexandrii TaxID=1917485 RepID=A0A1J0WE11_9RHOB|nr:5-carboxymethyl-2-hydroxymuconate Delta-isomerase [Sulfitobacter alexandrii]APE42553.1 5-carboxymethyl-2-hydroxymuconate isomerase [Sulfitobacter alexandrii]